MVENPYQMPGTSNPFEVQYNTYGAPAQNQTQTPQTQQPPAPTSNPFNYEAARDAWMSGKYSKDESGIRQWNSEFNALKNYQGGDTGDLINGGGLIDLLGNFKSGVNVSSNWTPAGGNGPNPNGQPAGPPAGTPPPGGPLGGAPPTGVSAELYDMLLSRAKQGTAINRNDPNIRQQVDPYTAQIERQRRDYLADAAEGMGSLANMRGEKRLASERAGQASGLFEAQIMGRELENRRAEISHALDSLGSRLSDDQRLALQRELGYLNDATQRHGIDAGERSSNAQIGLGRDRLGLDYSELDWRMDPRNPSNWA